MFGGIVAAARAQLSPDLLRRQAAAMDMWHRSGVANRQIRGPVLIAAGTEDMVIPPSNALKLVNAIPSLRPCIHCAVPAGSRRPNEQFSRAWKIRLTNGPLGRGYIGTEASSRSARPSSPAFADWLCVPFYVHFFQSFDAVFHRIRNNIGRFLISFSRRFE